MSKSSAKSERQGGISRSPARSIIQRKRAASKLSDGDEGWLAGRPAFVTVSWPTGSPGHRARGGYFFYAAARRLTSRGNVVRLHCDHLNGPRGLIEVRRRPSRRWSSEGESRMRRGRAVGRRPTGATIIEFFFRVDCAASALKIWRERTDGGTNRTHATAVPEQTYCFFPSIERRVRPRSQYIRCGRLLRIFLFQTKYRRFWNWPFNGGKTARRSARARARAVSTLRFSVATSVFTACKTIPFTRRLLVHHTRTRDKIVDGDGKENVQCEEIMAKRRQVIARVTT